MTREEREAVGRFVAAALALRKMYGKPDREQRQRLADDVGREYKAVRALLSPPGMVPLSEAEKAHGRMVAERITAGDPGYLCAHEQAPRGEGPVTADEIGAILHGDPFGPSSAARIAALVAERWAERERAMEALQLERYQAQEARWAETCREVGQDEATVQALVAAGDAIIAAWRPRHDGTEGPWHQEFTALLAALDAVKGTK